jgi:hypothetical protein
MASARDFMERWRRERESEGPTLAEVAAAIGKLEGEVPPSLDSDLPDMDRVKDRLESQSEVDRYNELVPRFNAELIRRRRFSAQSMLEVALAWRAAARRLLSEPERTLRAEIISPAYVLGSGFRRMKQSPGSEVVAERMPSEETFAARYYERTTIFLTSYPNGATVKVDGKRVGVTPLEIPDREVGGEARGRGESGRSRDEAAGRAPGDHRQRGAGGPGGAQAARLKLARLRRIAAPRRPSPTANSPAAPGSGIAGVGSSKSSIGGSVG